MFGGISIVIYFGKMVFVCEWFQDIQRVFEVWFRGNGLQQREGLVCGFKIFVKKWVLLNFGWT